MSDDSRTIRFERSAVLRGITVLQAALLVAVAVPRIPPLMQLPVAVAYLTIVPGLLLSSLLGIDDRPLATKSVYVVGLSSISIMTVGATISLFYPLVGIERPLSPVPLAMTLLLVVAALTAVVVRRGTSLTVTVPDRSVFSPAPLVLLLLPFMSVLGTTYYQLMDSNVVLLVMLTLVALVPLTLVATDRFGRTDGFDWYALATWTVSLALVYHGGSLFPPYLGGVKAGSLTMVEGIWLPNAQGLGGLLPNVVLYPIYAILGGVPLAAETALVNPFFVSVLPVTLFELFRRHTTRLYAFLSCCVFVFSFPFYVLYPVGGRVATPVFFLALLGLTLTDQPFRRFPQSLLVFVFSAALIVSHYGTAWVAMFAISIAMMFRFAFKYIIRMKESAEGRIGAARNDITIPSLASFGFYVVLAISWYMYTSQGVKFKSLPIKIVGAIEGVLYFRFGGSAANVVTKQYGSQIVSISRMVYIFIGFLIGLGILVSIYARLIEDRQLVGDGFLSYGVGFFAMLVGSALPSGGGFAIARVMMIVFVLTLPFLMIGLNFLFSKVENTHGRAQGILPSNAPSIALSIVLAAFLILNTGVATNLLNQDYAPSKEIGEVRLSEAENPIVRGQVDSCTECNIRTHVWIMLNNPGRDVYGDEYVKSQTDYYQSALAPRVGFSPQPKYYRSPSEANGSYDGYLLLMGRNLDTDGVYRTRYNWTPLESLNISLERGDVLYSSGSTRIYASNDGMD